jgi:hypothetical protein
VVKSNMELDNDTALASLHSECCYGCMKTEGWPFDPSEPQLLTLKRNDKLMRVP